MEDREVNVFDPVSKKPNSRMLGWESVVVFALLLWFSHLDLFGLGDEILYVIIGVFMLLGLALLSFMVSGTIFGIREMIEAFRKWKNQHHNRKE